MHVPAGGRRDHRQAGHPRAVNSARPAWAVWWSGRGACAASLQCKGRSRRLRVPGVSPRRPLRRIGGRRMGVAWRWIADGVGDVGDQACGGQRCAVGRKWPMGSLVGHGRIVVLDGQRVAPFGDVCPGEPGRDKGMMQGHREAAAGGEDAGGLSDSGWHVVEVVQAHEGDDEVCRFVREGQPRGVADDGRGAARVGERSFDKRGGRVGADDSVAGRGQGTGEATLTASDIDGQASGRWQEAEEVAKVKQPEIVVQLRRSGPAHPGIGPRLPSLTQVHLDSVIRRCPRSNRPGDTCVRSGRAARQDSAPAAPATAGPRRGSQLSPARQGRQAPEPPV